MEIRYSQHGLRSLRKLPREYQALALRLIESLGGDWRGLHVERLQGRGEWKLKHPPLRVIFERDGVTLTIRKVALRKDAYR